MQGWVNYILPYYLADDPYGLWTFDGPIATAGTTVSDLTGNGRTATVVASTKDGSTPIPRYSSNLPISNPNTGWMVNEGGENAENAQHCTITGSTGLPWTGLTAEVLCIPNAHYGLNQPVIEYQWSDTTSREGFSWGPQYQGRWRLGLVGYSIDNVVVGENHNNTADTLDTADVGQLTHRVATWDGSTGNCSFYRNGEEDGSTSSAIREIRNFHTRVLFRRAGPTYGSWGGIIFLVAIYPSVIPQDRIATRWDMLSKTVSHEAFVSLFF